MICPRCGGGCASGPHTVDDCFERASADLRALQARAAAAEARLAALDPNALPAGGATAEGVIFAVGEIDGFPVGKRTITIELDTDPGPVRFRDRVRVTWLGRSGA